MKQSLCLVLRLILGSVFVYAGFAKALEPITFVHSIKEFAILSDDANLFVAAFLPYCEILIGAGLIFRVFYSGALLLSGILLIVFIGVIGSAIWRGIDISCGCFGKLITWNFIYVELGRDSLLLLIWVSLIWLYIHHDGYSDQMN